MVHKTINHLFGPVSLDNSISFSAKGSLNSCLSFTAGFDPSATRLAFYVNKVSFDERELDDIYEWFA